MSDPNANPAAPKRGRLPPLDQRAGMRSQQGSVPPIGRSPPQGADAAYTGKHIVSMPQGGGATAALAGETLISMPGDSPARYADQADRYSEKQSTSNKPPLDIIIYFMDKSGVNIPIVDGQNIEAGELFDIVKEEMKLPDQANEMFSLWLVSDLLELQLKPTHVPFKLACYWEELLEKYTSASEEDIERDEPVIMFQRNVFFSRAKERKCQDPELLRLLYHEAKENVVDGRYPLELGPAVQLAGYQALISHGTFDQDMHHAEYYKPILEDYFSQHLCKKKSIFSKRDKMEDYIVRSHYNAFKEYGNVTKNSPVGVKVYQKYLDHCWNLPYYGAAFFKGQIEHPGQPVLRNVVDDPVYLAINTAGVFIIDMDDVVFLMGLLFEQMKWEYAEPKDANNRNCMPCLFFSFVDKVGREKLTKVLQVFTKEAKLVDALIETCMKLKIERKKRKEDVTDGIVDEDDDGVIESEGETWKQFNRLCLTTFNNKGEMISTKAKGVQKKK